MLLGLLWLHQRPLKCFDHILPMKKLAIGYKCLGNTDCLPTKVLIRMKGCITQRHLLTRKWSQ
ncbi:hypothetical protein A2348_00110 [Candidatus Uhrbacteria bacterium RIFOXYB12_FULL_58_10]|nr:MAG: hypothetical protein A2348_00110 [Candidatus Uhrbacteria bacterium RIFOXYB12_FULL_58_10]